MAGRKHKISLELFITFTQDTSQIFYVLNLSQSGLSDLFGGGFIWMTGMIDSIS